MQFKDVRQVEWDDVVEAIEKCYELGWTDGLPVVPPTVERVAAFLEYVGRAPDDVLGMLPERRRAITVGKVAANAVMAGCKPEYFPVVIAATEAMLDPAFNLIGPSSSQGSAAVTVFAGWSPRQLRCDADPHTTLDCAADVASTFGTSLCTADSVGDISLGVRQGQMVLTVAGASAFWRDWSKQDVRAYLHPRIGRSVADLKRVKVLDGAIAPGDAQRRILFVPEPDDILIVYAGGPEGTGYRCAVILSELPKVASAAVTKAITIP